MARRPSEPDYDDDAPWLSSVQAERDTTTFVPQRRLIGGVLVFLVLLAVIVGGIWWMTARARQGGSSATAPAGHLPDRRRGFPGVAAVRCRFRTG